MVAKSVKSKASEKSKKSKGLGSIKSLHSGLLKQHDARVGKKRTSCAERLRIGQMVHKSKRAHSNCDTLDRKVKHHARKLGPKV